MMDCRDVSEQLVDAYYGECDAETEAGLTSHRAACASCQSEWAAIAGVSQAFRTLSEQEPSRLSYQKIMVFAREAAERRRRPFWAAFWQPALSFSIMAFVAVMAFVQFERAQPKVTVATLSAPVDQGFGQTLASLPDLRLRAANSPMAHSPLNEDYQLNNFLSGGAKVSSASVGGTNYALDADLDPRMLSQAPDNHDLETLYYRARKMEKLGDYNSAFDDYKFISQFYPRYDNARFALLGMARCLQRLDRKDDAVAVLKHYETLHGASQELDDWVDTLKSETF